MQCRNGNSTQRVISTHPVENAAYRELSDVTENRLQLIRFSKRLVRAALGHS